MATGFGNVTEVAIFYYSEYADFLRHEKAAVEAERSELAEFSPFRRADC